MTITSTASEISYATDGVSTVFPIPFVFDTSADLKIILTDSSGNPVVLSSGFSIAGGAGLTGTCTITPAKAAGYTLTILDNPDRTQTADYVDNDAFPAATHEGALDRSVRISKRIYQLLQKCVRVDDGDPSSGSGTLIGPVQSRKGKYLFFNAITGAVEYATAVIGSTLSQSIIGQFLYPQLAAEAATPPVFTIYAPSPRIDVRRYLTAWDDGSTQTAGLQAAINYAYSRKGRLILPDGLNVATGALSLTMGGNRATQGLAIEGPGWNGATITQVGAPAALIAINGGTPTGNPSEAPLVFEGFSLQGVGKTCHGITLNAVAYWFLNGVQLRGFDRGINLFSALIGTINGCMSNENKFGIFARRNGAGSTVNQIIVREAVINLNSSVGVDYSGGSQLQLRACDLEGNGTAADLTTGAVFIRGALAPDSLVAGILLDGNWLEANKGYGLYVEAPTGGCSTNIAVRGGNIVAQEGGRAIKVLGATRLLIDDLQCVTPGDTWDLTADQASLRNTICSTLTDSGITFPTYNNVNTALNAQYNGRVDSAVLTLSGCTTAPTANAAIVQQGDVITITFASLTAVSNTTACTLTGLPAKYRPTSGDVFCQATIEDNNVDKPQQLLIQSASGTIILYNNGSPTGFTAALSKGIRRCQVTYRL